MRRRFALRMSSATTMSPCSWLVHHASVYAKSLLRLPSARFTTLSFSAFQFYLRFGLRRKVCCIGFHTIRSFLPTEAWFHPKRRRRPLIINLLFRADTLTSTGLFYRVLPAVLCRLLVVDLSSFTPDGRTHLIFCLSHRTAA